MASIIRQSPLTGPNDRIPLAPCPAEKYRFTSALVKVAFSPSTLTVHLRFLFIWHLYLSLTNTHPIIFHSSSSPMTFVPSFFAFSVLFDVLLASA